LLEESAAILNKVDVFDCGVKTDNALSVFRARTHGDLEVLGELFLGRVTERERWDCRQVGSPRQKGPVNDDGAFQGN
jgi:hypothetical protein